MYRWACTSAGGGGTAAWTVSKASSVHVKPVSPEPFPACPHASGLGGLDVQQGPSHRMCRRRRALRMAPQDGGAGAFIEDSLGLAWAPQHTAEGSPGLRAGQSWSVGAAPRVGHPDGHLPRAGGLVPRSSQETQAEEEGGEGGQQGGGLEAEAGGP